MKRLLLTFAACLILPLLAGCVAWQEDIELHGVKFQKARVDAKGFVIGYIGADALVGGRPCRQGWLHLHPNGTLAGFTASQDIALARFTILAATWVFQNTDGIVTVCAFPRDIEIQGHVCRGSSGGSEGVQTAFYPDGALKLFFAPQPTRIDGVPCGSSLFQSGIELYENGRLCRANLSEDIFLNGQLYNAGERIHLTPEGKVQKD
jgi:hypothetical protein